jgi:ATP-dependent DNA helicase RecQ
MAMFIKLFKISRKQKLKKKEATTYKETLELYKTDWLLRRLLKKRKLGLIMSHLAKLYVDGAEIDLDSFISKEKFRKLPMLK